MGDKNFFDLLSTTRRHNSFVLKESGKLAKRRNQTAGLRQEEEGGAEKMDLPWKAAPLPGRTVTSIPPSEKNVTSHQRKRSKSSGRRANINEAESHEAKTTWEGSDVLRAESRALTSRFDSG